MKTNADTIQDIYNFCDAWCERCLFTQRCHSYQIQQENGIQQPGNPNISLVEQLTEALTMTKQYLNQVKKQQTPAGLTSAEQQTTGAKCAANVQPAAEQSLVTSY